MLSEDRIGLESVIAIAELASTQARLPTLQIKPQAVKSAVTGNGTASKSTVQSFVSKLLSVHINNDHESDAAAAAIAGLLKQRTPSLIS